MSNDIEEVKRSFGRCIAEASFLDRFYELFLKSSPVLAPMFEKTDFERQKKVLRNGINYMILYADGSKVATAKLEDIGKIHDRLRVGPDLYRFWIDSLIGTIKEHDEKFSPELEQAWRQALQPGMQLLQSFYKR